MSCVTSLPVGTTESVARARQHGVGVLLRRTALRERHAALAVADGEAAP